MNDLIVRKKAPSKIINRGEFWSLVRDEFYALSGYCHKTAIIRGWATDYISCPDEQAKNQVKEAVRNVKNRLEAGGAALKQIIGKKIA